MPKDTFGKKKQKSLTQCNASICSINAYNHWKLLKENSTPTPVPKALPLTKPALQKALEATNTLLSTVELNVTQLGSKITITKEQHNHYKHQYELACRQNLHSQSWKKKLNEQLEESARLSLKLQTENTSLIQPGPTLWKGRQGHNKHTLCMQLGAMQSNLIQWLQRQTWRLTRWRRKGLLSAQPKKLFASWWSLAFQSQALMMQYILYLYLLE